jgi:predicted NBD/HSP70 family sugar kinase
MSAASPQKSDAFCVENTAPRIVPDLDPGFIPAILWNREYRRLAAATRGAASLGIALSRQDGTTFTHATRILPHRGAFRALNLKYVERLVKFLLWQKGGCTISVAGCPPLAKTLARLYGQSGDRAFDRDIVGRRMFGRPIEVKAAKVLPRPKESSIALGRHLGGCRIGFDLGGSDRKCAAVIDGKVVFSEEVKWSPYFEKDPWYHLQGVNDTIRRAAEKLPRIDAIGGSAAGVYVNNEVRVASLFRGIAEDDFDQHIRRMFFALKEWWGGVPFEVVNDGEVTALAGSMSLKSSPVLGVSMGTSVAAGYVTPQGNITPWLNELAFVPVDYRADAPADEWSGDIGCGVQYFSQQAVARLAPKAGLEFPKEIPLAERLEEVQKLMAAGDERARRIYETIGTCFGYAIAHFAEFYEIGNLLILGRVTSGEGGGTILRKAREVLKAEFPPVARAVKLCTPSEKDKRHGQAIAAASLPAILAPGK